MKYRSGEYDKRRAKEAERLKAPIAQNASVRNKKVSIQEKGLHGMVSKKDLFFSVLIDVRERDGEYQAAIEYPAPRGKGSLCNGEIWCSTAMIDYCKNKLSHRKESPRREEL